MSSLYQKYRPQTFEELVDQDHIKITLENEIKTDQISHAYLFSGPRGIGKTTCARLLAKVVNCQNRKKGDSKPCNKCMACKEISQGKSLDVMEIDAASQTGVDNVRENIIENSRFVPHYSKYKIFIIDEAHMLSIFAFNALLKILEEPPAHIIFILATTEIHKIPETIISRCQRFNFKKINFLEIEKRLNKICRCEKIKVDPQILKNIARQSQGYLRDAESLLGQILVLGEKKISFEQAELILPHSNFDLILELLDYIFKKNKLSALILINKLVKQGIDLKYFINDCIEITRKILLIKIDFSLNEFSQEMDKKIEKRILELAEEIETEKLSKAIEILIETQKELDETEIIQLPLEIAVLKIIREEAQNAKRKTQNNLNETQKENSKLKTQNSKLQLKSQNEKQKNQFETDQPLADTEIINSSLKPLNLKSEIVNLKSLVEIKEKWEEILEEIKKYNHSIFTFLRTAELISLKENIFNIGFKHKFYQERINDKKNKEIIENVLENILKQKIILKTEIISEEEISSKQIGDQFLDDILNVFGGKVVS
ncbi:DNA polymerase III subunit gamma/tau [Candidatus Kuenenbacteria bacterium]|nr:DNA polymerase III subunit gamma/tau [Candidatus Kuenenbacteria bacterium]